MSDDNEILLYWIPSHTGISRNEQVDKITRSALSMVPEIIFKITYTNLKIKINKYILQQRQHHWSNNNYNKPLEIKPILGEWKQGFRKNWKEEVVFSSLRIQSLCDGTLHSVWTLYYPEINGSQVPSSAFLDSGCFCTTVSARPCYTWSKRSIKITTMNGETGVLWGRVNEDLYWLLWVR